MFHLLQVCNVGQILGGTAACAWSVTRSLPAFRHTVAFLSRVTDPTRDAFSGCKVVQWNRVTADRVAETGPDMVLLHNTSRSRCDERLPVPTVQYLHSHITPAEADRTICCSAWLAERSAIGRANVVYQGVPRPRRPDPIGETRGLREWPVIGRICTPTSRKWPTDLCGFYQELAGRFPSVRWEFVGCPPDLQDRLREACGGAARFVPASWMARDRLWQWDALLYHNPSVPESFGRTVAEAMRAGCVPIVDDRGGFREQVTESCGWLCRDETAFADAVEQLLLPARRRQMSRACRAEADARFSLAQFGEGLMAQFRQAAACRSTGGAGG